LGGILFSSILCTCPNQRRYSNYGVFVSKKGINISSVKSPVGARRQICQPYTLSAFTTTPPPPGNIPGTHFC
jgi:hypothetical protein